MSDVNFPFPPCGIPLRFICLFLLLTKKLLPSRLAGFRYASSASSTLPQLPNPFDGLL
jgi:hypothetical protein